MNAIITNHAKQRAKDRLGISKKIAEKIAQKALVNGIGQADASGTLKNYLDKLYFAHETANNIKIYNHKVYIFNQMVLITILNLPNNYIKIADKIQKRKKETSEEKEY